MKLTLVLLVAVLTVTVVTAGRRKDREPKPEKPAMEMSCLTAGRSLRRCFRWGYDPDDAVKTAESIKECKIEPKKMSRRRMRRCAKATDWEGYFLDEANDCGNLCGKDSKYEPVPTEPTPAPEPAPEPQVQPTRPAPEPQVQPTRPEPEPQVQPTRPEPVPVVEPPRPRPVPVVQPPRPKPVPVVQPPKPAPTVEECTYKTRVFEEGTSSPMQPSYYDRINSLDQCVNKCMSVTGCKAVHYIPNGRVAKVPRCYVKQAGYEMELDTWDRKVTAVEMCCLDGTCARRPADLPTARRVGECTLRGMAAPGLQLDKIEGITAFNTCVDKCYHYEGCEAVNYVASAKRCYLKPASDKPLLENKSRITLAMCCIKGTCDTPSK